MSDYTPWEPKHSLRCRIFGHSLQTVDEDYPNLGVQITHRCRRCSFGKGKGLLWASVVSDAAQESEGPMKTREDPVVRLIAAGKGWLEQHGDCSYEPCVELRDAIDYAEQRRALETRVAE